MLHVADGRGKKALEEFYQQFDGEQLARIQTVAMDMWEPYISVTTQYVAEAQKKIAFDKLTLPGTLGRPLTGCDAPSIAGWPARMISG